MLRQDVRKVQSTMMLSPKIDNFSFNGLQCAQFAPVLIKKEKYNIDNPQPHNTKEKFTTKSLLDAMKT